ncbi:L-histidine N(alpha)-methyltransferase [Catellatospora tritici]|uniref:L-histidine N(alpha)-methyltransferase n=1 Tax=Catellatospora tritici TaxID=2851566 RepID=UPI001C2D6049|nr:L-histidine N(alpha)-methyltransferase [Catellatospora tritici]MBV1849995.1 L-histidine N(alpha)-methyltransferase [Catellatospora tritici]
MSDVRSYFESEHHREEFRKHLARRTVPVKFAFAGSGALTYEALANSDGYQEVVGELDFELDALFGQTGLGQGSADQVCEVGPGNGLHTAALLAALTARGLAPSRYLCLDFSQDLLTIVNRPLAKFPMEFRSDVWDFESGATGSIARWRRKDEPVLGLMLGHTIGNPVDPLSVLRNMRDSLNPGDLILISVALLPERADEARILSPYRNETFTNAAIEPLRAAGIPSELIRFDLCLRDVDVIGDAIITGNVTAMGIDIAAGERIRCFKSRRFRGAEFGRLVEAAGWTVTRQAQDGTAEHGAILASAA